MGVSITTASDLQVSGTPHMLARCSGYSRSARRPTRQGWRHWRRSLCCKPLFKTPLESLPCLGHLFLCLTSTAAADADGSQPRPPSRIPLPQAQTAGDAGAHTVLPSLMQPEGAEQPQVLHGTATAGLLESDIRTRPPAYAPANLSPYLQGFLLATQPCPCCALSSLKQALTMMPLLNPVLSCCQPGLSCNFTAAPHLHACTSLLLCKSDPVSTW